MPRQQYILPKQISSTGSLLWLDWGHDWGRVSHSAEISKPGVCSDTVMSSLHFHLLSFHCQAGGRKIWPWCAICRCKSALATASMSAAVPWQPSIVQANLQHAWLLQNKNKAGVACPLRPSYGRLALSWTAHLAGLQCSIKELGWVEKVPPPPLPWVDAAACGRGRPDVCSPSLKLSHAGVTCTKGWGQLIYLLIFLHPLHGLLCSYRGSIRGKGASWLL